MEVLSFLSVSSVDYWAYRPALQQVAAWYWTLKHPEQSGSVGERAARAVAEVASEGYGRALEFIAYRYALATGIIDETGFPEAVAAHWLTTEERHGLGNDPISISARVITRTLFVVRLLPAIDHFLDLLRKDSRLPRWRAMAAHALCERDDLARQKPHLNLGRPDPTQLKRLFGARWGTQVNRIELARRGLMTEDAFYAAATPFAVAAVDDQLPRIEVGTLGPAPLSADVPERHFDFGSV
ncbi:TfuA-like protein [Mycobacterium tuberculosis]|nr:TfuA-like protein [Mycobacterium tuberculosis]